MKERALSEDERLTKLYALLGQYWKPKPRRSKSNLETAPEPESGSVGSADPVMESGDGKEKQEDGKEGDTTGELKQGDGSDHEIPATQRDPQSPTPSKSKGALEYPLVRTPQKVNKDGYEDGGEIFDAHLAWALGGSLPPTVKAGPPWEPTPPRQSKPCEHDEDDELQRAEYELKKLEFLVGMLDFKLKTKDTNEHLVRSGSQVSPCYPASGTP